MDAPSPPPVAVFSPPPQLTTFLLVADYFEGQFDQKAFRAAQPRYPVLSVNPLILEPRPGTYLYLARFGTLVSWNCPEELLAAVHRELIATAGAGRLVESVQDRLAVHLGADADQVGFSEIWLRDLTLDKVKIISLALAQSVALEYFEGAVSEAMARFQPVVHELSRQGRLSLSHGDALHLIGFALETRAAVLDNLTLFDVPPEAWESELIAHLDGALYDHFDLEERLGSIQGKLAYLSDAGARVMDVLTARRNQVLEWIIIVLIAVEIVFFVWKEMVPGSPG